MNKRALFLGIILLVFACNLPGPETPSGTAAVLTEIVQPTNLPATAEADTPVIDTEPPPATETPGILSPIVVGFYAEGAGNTGSGLLLGASQGSHWLSPAEVSLAGGETFHLYSPYGYYRSGTGGAPYSESIICPADQYVDVSPKPEAARELIAIGGSWNAIPRVFETLPNDIEEYAGVIRGLLESNGLASSAPNLVQTLRVDLDGDSTLEVLLAASHFKSPGLPGISAGDYSIVVLRTFVGSDAVTVPLAADYYTADESPAAANRYSILGILDLNGDGRLEIVLRGTRYEGASTVVFEVTGTDARPVLSHDCGGYKPAKPVPAP